MDDRRAGERATSFGSAAEDYARYRPAPPAEAALWALATDGNGPEWGTVVDIAAGTGNLTQHLLPLAERVIAVDLDPRMLAVLGRRLTRVPRVKAYGEVLPLRSGAADAAVISSAWHWMDHSRFWPELARVLRPGGRFGVVSSGIDRSVEWVGDVLGWRRQSEGESSSPDDGNRWRDHRRVQPPPGGLFGEVEERTFRLSLPWAVGDLPHLAGSYSHMLVLPEEERRAMRAEVAARAARRPELAGSAIIELPIRTHVWRATRTGG
jgi:SAM-dependent methyltransferase